MKMALVKDGEVVMDYLPSKYTLNGQTISNYHLLDLDTLEAEGWLPLIDDRPDYDSEVEEVVVDGYEINDDSVTKLYKIREIGKTESEVLKVRLEATEIALMELLMEG